jgi:hypothetical protein
MLILRTAVLFLSLCLAGCLATQTRTGLSNQIQVFGIELYSATDYREINGIKAVEEPCLKGYERIFDPLDITIGYGFNRKIRKITTMNRGTCLFGITPGIPADEGRRLARQTGLTEVSPVRYRSDDLSLFLHIDEKGILFGLTVESVD